MKKLLVAMIATALVAGCIATSAVAEDRLSLAGQVRVRALSLDNYAFAPANDIKNEYWDQRFRLQATVTPADGVKGVLRFDVAEDIWGGNNWTGSRYSAGVANAAQTSPFGDTGTVSAAASTSAAGELQVDRAYLDVTKGIFNVKAGQAYFGLGNFFAYDANNPGIAISIKTPVTITLGYLKIDEDQTAAQSAQFGTATNLDDEIDAHEDIDHYFLNLAFKTDVFGINAFYAQQVDGSDAGNEPILYGATAIFGVGPVKINAELDIFDGDLSDTVEYTGIQFLVDASMAFSDALTLGLQGVYSDGTDDAAEAKITRMPNAFFGSMYYADYGAFATDIAPLRAGDIFDPLNTEAGAMGGGIYVKFMPMSGLSIYGQGLFLTGVEDSVEGMFDNGFVVNVSAEYMLVKNATIAVGYNYTDVELIDDAATPATFDTDNAQAMVARLQITF